MAGTGKELLTRPEVAVFGSSAPAAGDAAYAQAETLGRLLALAGFDVINGGHEGVMAASARGAASAGGAAVGVTCGDLRAARGAQLNPYLTHVLDAPTLLARLEILLRRAAGYVFLPGGPGTLAELGLAWEHVSKGLLPGRVLVCAGDFWLPTVDAVRRVSPEAGDDVLIVVDNVEEAVAQLRRRLEPVPAEDAGFVGSATWVDPRASG